MMPKARIMVVEDESIIAIDIQNGLENLGYEVPAIVSSGEEAIHIAGELRPDLILMDIVLEGHIDGVEAADQILARFDIPVIYLTAYADDDTLQRAKITRPFGYILKPFDERELQTAIEMALYKHEMDRKLKKSEQWLATTLKSIGDAVIATDNSGSITFMNPVAEELTGWSQQDAMGRDLTEVFNISSPGRPTENPAIMALKERTAVALPDDTMLISKDSTRKPISDSIAPIKDDREGLQGAVLVFQDITERKHAEEELKAAHQQLEDIIEFLPDATFVIDKEKKVIAWNRAVEEMTGIPKSAMIGKGDYSCALPFYGRNRPMLIDLLSQKDPDTEAKYQYIEWKGDTLYAEVFVPLVSGGKGATVWAKASPLFDSRGQMVGSIESIRDITDRKISEEKLKSSEARYRSLSNNITDGIYLIDSDFKPIFFNPAMENIFGRKNEFFLSDYQKALLSCVHPDDRHMIQRSFFTGKLKEGQIELSYRILRPDGEIRYLRDVMRVVPSSDGTGCAYQGIISDMTEIKRSQEELVKARDELELRVEERTAELALANEVLSAEIIERKKAEEMLKASLQEKEVLLREIHHRVKNNLQIVSSLLYLQSRSVTDDDSAETFKESQNRVKSMALIHEKLYRSESLARVDFADYIRNLVAYLFQSYGVASGKVDLRINIDEVLLGIDTAIPCGLIINELVSNSLKHAFPDGRRGEISIDLHSYGDSRFKMVVTDNGIGFKDSMDFKKTQTLGLQLVNTLVKQIDGRIKLDTRNGSRFEIDFNELKYKERS